MWHNLRYAVRQLARTPGFTAVAVLILATGIGATTAVFTIINGLLFRALPVRDPEQLVLFEDVRTTPSGSLAVDQFSYPTFERFRDHTKCLSGIAVVKTSTRTLLPKQSDPSGAVRVHSSAVSDNFFRLLGTSSLLGRIFSVDDDKRDTTQPVAILSHSLWRRQFGSDPAILGKTVVLDNAVFSIVGIMPEAFVGIEPASPVDLWIPVQSLPLLDPGRSPLEGDQRFLMLGRLKPDVARAAAGAELDAAYQTERSERRHAVSARDRVSTWGKLQLMPGGGGRMERRQDLSQLLLTLFVVVGFVLMLVCANVASLMLARTAARQRELAIRAALGAGRRRLVFQLISEGLVLSTAGGLLGLLVLRWMLDALSSRAGGAQISAMSVDTTVLGFVSFISIASGILVGALPAWKFSRVDVNATLKDQSGGCTGGQRQKAVRALVVVQIAVSVCLLVGAGVFIRGLLNLKNVDLGFRQSNLLLVNVGTPKEYSESQQTDLITKLLKSFDALPGVKRSTVSSGGLWDGGHQFANIRVEGHTPVPGEDMRVVFTQAGPFFFEQMGIPLLRGRGFASEEIFATEFSRPQVVVINETLAKRFFGEKEPIGRTISLLSGQARVVGVARNIKYMNLRDENSLQIYLPFSPDKGGRPLAFSLRLDESARNVVASAAALLQNIDPNVRAKSIQLMDERLERFVVREKLIADVAGYFGVFAAVLACLGLYGLLAYDVAQRTREFGVRLALGAPSSSLISLVLKQGLTLATAGCVIGSVAAFILIHFVASKLYGVSAADPVTFVAISSLLLGISVLACLLPTYRATKADPMAALRAN